MTQNIKCITHDSFCRSEIQEQLSQVAFVVLAQGLPVVTVRLDRGRGHQKARLGQGEDGSLTALTMWAPLQANTLPPRWGS